MSIPVGELAPAGCWDVTMLRDLFANRLYETGLQFQLHAGYPNTDGAVIVIPGRYWHERTTDITQALSTYEWVLAIRTADEEEVFNPRDITHPNLRWWIQTPRVGIDYGDSYLFGVGYTPHFNDMPTEPPRKRGAYLSAQDTHERRHLAFDALRTAQVPTKTRKTGGFTQGVPPEQYAQEMCEAQVAVCPSGPASPDSFRLYEALQAHTTPLADDITPRYRSRGYWRMVHPDAPFPVYQDPDVIPGYCQDQIGAWPVQQNRITAWWMRYKRAMAIRLVDDLKALGAC